MPKGFKKPEIFQKKHSSEEASPARPNRFVPGFLLYLLMLTGLGTLCLILAPGSYPLDFCRNYWSSPALLVLNALPVFAFGLLFYGLFGRAQWAFLGTSAVVLGLAAGNYWKIAFRDDPLMFGDLLILREAGTMAGRYQPYWDRTMIFTVLSVLIAFVCLFLLARRRITGKKRAVLAICGAVLLAAAVYLSLSDSIYSSTAPSEYVENEQSDTEQYIGRGFLYPFLHSISSTVELPPKGYREADARLTMDQYRDAAIPADQQVNFICIQFESFQDFSRFGTPLLATDPYVTWHQLEAEGYSGNLVTNVFAGNTIDTERCFLTGFSTLREIRRNTNSIPWFFRSQGYTVEGLHPSPQWFYNRKNVNSALGFETYYFMENLFSAYTEWPTAGDDILFPVLLEKYKEAEQSGKPYFNFTVTYQGHGPYNDHAFYWERSLQSVMSRQDYTEEEYYILCNYFASIESTDRNIGALTDYLREDDAPVVLVLYGDHNPWMGNGGSLYNRLGIGFDQSSLEGFMNYYATRYIIWANDPAKAVLGCDFAGEGPDLSPCFLMNQVFELCGWDGPAFMQASDPAAHTCPVIHETGRFLSEGNLTYDLPADKLRIIREYQALEYYWRTHFAYGQYAAG